MNFTRERLEKEISEISNLADLIELINIVNRHVSSKTNARLNLITEKQLKFFFTVLKKDLNKLKDNETSYKEFKISKKNGGERVIHAPNDHLKLILKCIDILLRIFIQPHHKAFGFVDKKNIVDNAKIHTNKNYVYNIDLKDFFYSFDIQQVKWVFYNQLFHPIANTSLREEMAFSLANLVTYTINGSRTLPQGSPCSPTLTNMLCKRLDFRLNRLAKKNGSEFSRYADDITFSANHNIFKSSFLVELKEIIRDENLEINTKKTRLQRGNERQEVTGITVNQDVNVSRKYVKELRSILYRCETYGKRKTEEWLQSITSNNKKVNIELYLKGKLNYLSMVKGINDSTYIKLDNRYKKLFKQISFVQSIIDTWQKDGIDTAIKKHGFKLKTKTKKIKNDYLDSYEPYDTERSFEINIKNLIGKKRYYEIKEKLGDKDDVSIIYYNYARQSKPWKDLLSSDSNDLQDEKRFIHLIYQLFAHNNCFNDDEWGSIFKYWKKNNSLLDYDRFLFFALLINNVSITKAERLIVQDLWITEVGLSKEENSTTTDNAKEPDAGPKNMPTYIDPTKLYKALLAYNQNPILKTTCHPMSSDNIEKVIQESDSSEYDFKKHLKLIKQNFEALAQEENFTHKMYALIKNYLFGEGEWSSQKVKYGWSNKELANWCEKNPKHVPNPEDTIVETNGNEGYLLEQPFISKLTNHTIESFNDLVLYFKSLWHIKSDNPLQRAIEKTNSDNKYNEWTDFEFINFSQTMNLFTDVDKLVQAYSKIIGLIKENSTSNRQNIRLSFFDQDGKKILSIHQLSTFWKKSILDTIERPFGNSMPPIIKNQINGLCDLHIRAKFEDEKSYKVNLWDGKERTANPIDDKDGVEYLLVLKK